MIIRYCHTIYIACIQIILGNLHEDFSEIWRYLYWQIDILLIMTMLRCFKMNRSTFYVTRYLQSSDYPLYAICSEVFANFHSHIGIIMHKEIYSLKVIMLFETSNSFNYIY